MRGEPDPRRRQLPTLSVRLAPAPLLAVRVPSTTCVAESTSSSATMCAPSAAPMDLSSGSSIRVEGVSERLTHEVLGGLKRARTRDFSGHKQARMRDV